MPKQKKGAVPLKSDPNLNQSVAGVLSESYAHGLIFLARDRLEKLPSEGKRDEQTLRAYYELRDQIGGMLFDNLVEKWDAKFAREVAQTIELHSDGKFRARDPLLAAMWLLKKRISKDLVTITTVQDMVREIDPTLRPDYYEIEKRFRIVWPKRVKRRLYSKKGKFLPRHS